MENEDVGNNGPTRAEMNAGQRRQIAKMMSGSRLRYLLYMTLDGGLDNTERAAYIYEALSHAQHLGYTCGMRVYDNVDGGVDVYAAIDLPSGKIAFMLAEYDGEDFKDMPDDVRKIVEAYIGDEGYGRS